MGSPLLSKVEHAEGELEAQLAAHMALWLCSAGRRVVLGVKRKRRSGKSFSVLVLGPACHTHSPLAREVRVFLSQGGSYR
jgi:hypothetical protein